jgi:hypothetical protein
VAVGSGRQLLTVCPRSAPLRGSLPGRHTWTRGPPRPDSQAALASDRQCIFPVAAWVNGQWWVLRLNGFPDHPLWTFIHGESRFDIDDTPAAWATPSKTVSFLEDKEANEALTPVRDFVAYGSEVGEPCDNPFCCG